MTESAFELPGKALTVAVIGASGFVGKAVMAAVTAAGHQVIPVSAVRLRSCSTSVGELLDEAAALDPEVVNGLAAAASGADVAINTAGMATPGAAEDGRMMGANALLPPVLGRVALAAGWARLVHVSSAAVYGVGRLAEDTEAHPISPYGRSKLLGELALMKACETSIVRAVILRATSVHGPDRAVTRTLIRIAKSPLASVAGAGNQPTPQVGVTNVAAAAVYLATCRTPPDLPVLQPWEGLSTAQVLRTLGQREPRHIPLPAANALIKLARLAGHFSPQIGADARRLEMLWFGQSQAPGWFDAMNWTPPDDWIHGSLQRSEAIGKQSS